jgi:tRNA pseudouridine38-40 synthase
MVRNIMGCLVEIGAGRRPVAWMREVLDSRSRALAAPTLAPDGLYLAGIDYDATWHLGTSNFPGSTMLIDPPLLDSPLLDSPLIDPSAS